MDMDSCHQTWGAALWTPAHRPGGAGGGRDIAELAGMVKHFAGGALPLRFGHGRRAS
jgi:hypothetical protein